jgi:hypothetical protein
VLVRTLVAGLGLVQISARFEEHTEVERRARMPQCIGFAIGKLGAGRVTPLFEQNSEAEPLDGSPRVADQSVCDPRHPPAAFRTAP